VTRPSGDGSAVTTRPFVSIVIPTKNAGRILGSCLESILALNYPKDRYEIVVADGRSSDDTVAVALSAGARVVDDGGQGWCRVFGLNAALPEARGSYVAFLDADCRVVPQWIIASMPHFEDPSVAGVGGPVLADPGASLLARAIVATLALVPTPNTPPTASDVLHLAGCNAIYRAGALRMVFPLPEVESDDVALSKLIRQLGLKLRHEPRMAVLTAPYYDRISDFARHMRLYGFARRELEAYNLRWWTWPGAWASSGLIWLPALLALDVLSAVNRYPNGIAVAALQLGVLLSLMAIALRRTRSVRIAALVPFLLAAGAFAFSWGYLTARWFVHGRRRRD
jgi:glycosyltransferase involved in cell wall biosynthesis